MQLLTLRAFYERPLGRRRWCCADLTARRGASRWPGSSARWSMNTLAQTARRGRRARKRLTHFAMQIAEEDDVATFTGRINDHSPEERARVERVLRERDAIPSLARTARNRAEAVALARKALNLRGAELERSYAPRA